MVVIVMVLAASLYAVAISFGIGKRITEDDLGVVLATAGGVAIILITRLWGNWDMLAEWFGWFALGGIPLLIRGLILHLHDQERRELDRHRIHSHEQT